MINFGNYSIVSSTTHAFEKAPDWYWKFKAPTSGDELTMNKFIYRTKDGDRYIPPTNLEICHRELAILFEETNIPATEKSVEEGGAPILAKGASVEAVEAVIRQMPPKMVEELWAALAEANPDGKWGPELPKDSD